MVSTKHGENGAMNPGSGVVIMGGPICMCGYRNCEDVCEDSQSCGYVAEGRGDKR